MSPKRQRASASSRRCVLMLRAFGAHGATPCDPPRRSVSAAAGPIVVQDRGTGIFQGDGGNG
jgi:hypothetical protein